MILSGHRYLSASFPISNDGNKHKRLHTNVAPSTFSGTMLLRMLTRKIVSHPLMQHTNTVQSVQVWKRGRGKRFNKVTTETSLVASMLPSTAHTNAANDSGKQVMHLLLAAYQHWTLHCSLVFLPAFKLDTILDHNDGWCANFLNIYSTEESFDLGMTADCTFFPLKMLNTKRWYYDTHWHKGGVEISESWIPCEFLYISFRNMKRNVITIKSNVIQVV